MAIITISRELAALGDEIASELAKKLNYRLVDKNTLEQKIKSYGVDGAMLKKYDERKPPLWASLSQDRDNYLHFLKTSQLAEAKLGNAVFVGRGASAIFKDIPGVLSIFLVATPEIRVERVKSYFHCDEKKAKGIIEKSDNDRIGFYHYFFDMDWRAPENYLLTLNTGRTHPLVCTEIIKRLADYHITEETQALHEMRIKDATLAQEIKHFILYEKEAPVHFLDVVVSGDKIVLYGVANSQALVDAAMSAAIEKAMGYSSLTVISEIQVVQEYSIVP
ncbi:MAG: cytidylate kinase-like family protein [Treponema sp.]|jgi:cytidylate kinase|nr:cytidylate kinase-like family protein [Treponema sp.]